MKKLVLSSVCLGCIFAPFAGSAIDLKQSKITQVVNQVSIISASDQQQKAAAVNDVFTMPDILSTGPASRAELVAQDETVTRVGANTIFSFDPASRTIDLKQGSLLFHAPHGKGGGSIHTGSATASVLGTTIIVAATPNGGFKVIVLEGQAEIHFLNGLEQKLNPGQMTFVLPGANQLAPVIIFRLDELIQNSLLVKGFAGTLSSLPLIQNQIIQQLKQIHSGKLSDTGLYAGNDATVNQVEVLDINTIQSGQNQQPKEQPLPGNSPPPPPTPNLNAAELADATINQPSLAGTSIPTPPLHVFTGAAFQLKGNNYFNEKNFIGFVARNIFVNTPSAALNPLVVNMSPYATMPAFDLVALNNFLIEGSVTFSGLAANAELDLIAGAQFTFTPGVSVEADVHNFVISSPAALSFDDVSLKNSVNNLTLNSAGDISFLDGASASVGGALTASTAADINVTDSQIDAGNTVLTSIDGSINFDNATLNAKTHSIFIAPITVSLTDSTINSDFVTLSATATGSITLTGTTINAPSSIVAASTGDINITGDTVVEDAASHTGRTSGNSALNADPSSGTVALTSAQGSVIVSGTDISAHYLSLSSGDGILLDASGHTVFASGTGSQAKFTAANLVTVRNAELSSFAVVNMAANTINLSDVAFGAGSTVTLKSLLGLLNVGSSVPGYVNFIENVTYGGNPAQNYVNNGGGITVTKL